MRREEGRESGRDKREDRGRKIERQKESWTIRDKE
jgi:hypothetical protein